MPYTYQYPRAALTVDCVVFGFDEGELKLLLIERALEPFQGQWALPGGFVRMAETIDQAARRELAEEAGLKDLSFFWGHVYRETPPYGRGKIARYYVAQTREKDIELPIGEELGRPEHHEARWVSYPEARSFLLPRLISILDWANALITGPKDSTS